KKGILDLTHTRLFTFDSLRRLLEESGFVVLSEKGIPAPFPHAASNRKLADFLLNLNDKFISLWKELFSYQIFVVVKPKPSLPSLLKDAVEHSRLKGLALDAVVPDRALSGTTHSLERELSASASTV
ncbi:MAG TPA: hypothetical protein PL012_18765, partial [Candidatus Obscuribacter sp.]|nr:hypothetical protein [Candidatus Obscuribacter sp.]